MAPTLPPQHLRDLLNQSSTPEAEYDEAESLLKLKLPLNAPSWQRQSLLFLKDRVRVPEPLLALIYRIGWKFWTVILVWMVLVKVSGPFFGPVLIVASVFVLIFSTGFSQRAEGSLSGYSLFNPHVQRLPGQITADHLDGQLRRGQM